MKLKHKIFFSNMLMIAIPVTLAVILWHTLTSTSAVKGVNSKTQNVLYYYNTAISEMQWNALYMSDGELLLSPDEQRINELTIMGYHIRIKSGQDVLFCNFDQKDKSLINENMKSDTEEEFIRYGDRYVICDIFYLNYEKFYITAVYDPSRADSSISDSIVPIYMVSTSALLFLIAAIVLSVVALSSMLSIWLKHSVIKPLETLKQSSEHIANGDYEHREYYFANDEFSDVYAAFETMRCQLKENEEERSRFENARQELLNGLSHDLRSPLTSVKGYAEGIRDGIADTEERRRKYCDAIITRAEDIERMTIQLSQLVRLSRSGESYHFTSTSIDEFLRELIQEKALYSEENHIMIHYKNNAEDMTAEMDTAEMRRVFTNLLENVVRHRVTNSSNVCITVSKVQNKAEICFLDDGPGVRSDQLDYLFESFYRADESRTRPENGSGLGLAVVKNIIVGHGGTVTAYLDDGLGIRMILPIEEE